MAKAELPSLAISELVGTITIYIHSPRTVLLSTTHDNIIWSPRAQQQMAQALQTHQH